MVAGAARVGSMDVDRPGNAGTPSPSPHGTSTCLALKSNLAGKLCGATLCGSQYRLGPAVSGRPERSGALPRVSAANACTFRS